MTYEPIQQQRILAIDPLPRGFGFVVLEEEPLQLVDWGVATCRKKQVGNCLGSLLRLLRQYRPSVLVLEDPKETRISRQQALIAFMASIGELPEADCLPMQLYSRTMVRQAFQSVGAWTKEAIVVVLARQFPELAPRVPPRRQIWQSEDSRMSIFDALVLGLTHLALGREQAAQAA